MGLYLLRLWYCPSPMGATLLPNSRIVLLDAGHFVWEEARAQYAAAVLESLGRKD